MTEIVTHDQDIKDLVYVIRGQQVILDSDLAKLYGTEVKNLNRQVKRNIERFPDDFMFRLTLEEANEVLRCQNGSLNKSNDFRGLHIKYAPYAFTEQGIYMVATILKNDIAAKQSIVIMRTFKEMRHYIAENQTLLNNTDLLKLSNTVVEHEKRMMNIESSMATKSDIEKIMDNFIDDSNIKEITILNGQKFEAIEAYTKIYKQAQHSIYIIDDYININTLSPLKYKKEMVHVILFSDNKGTGAHKLRQHEIDVFNSEYPNLTLKSNRIAHDRYIIIDYRTDNEKMYHCGASCKDAGKKVCGINEINDGINLHSMIDALLKEIS